jgi:hypothetical protein
LPRSQSGALPSRSRRRIASWLNLIEGFFSKLARSVLRHIRVSSKDELKQRLIAFIGDINREPVVHTWRYKIDNAA